jgi:cation transport ATPase
MLLDDSSQLYAKISSSIITKSGSHDQDIGQIDQEKSDPEMRRADAETHHRTENWKIERKLKEKLAMWVVAMVTIYLTSVIAILFVILFSEENNLEDSVLITLLTTTTINVLGLPYLIIKSLFGSDKDQEKLQN